MTAATSRRARVAAQQQVARRALELAAERAGAPPLEFPRDEHGAPVAEKGWHHSLANTRGLVVALVAPCPVGVDAEAFSRPRTANLVEYLEDEPRSLDPDPERAALRLWSAKEAVLKLLGLGVAGLPRCRLESAGRGASVPGPETLVLTFEGSSYRCVQRLSDEHVVSVACANAFEVPWPADLSEEVAS